MAGRNRAADIITEGNLTTKLAVLLTVIFTLENVVTIWQYFLVVIDLNCEKSYINNCFFINNFLLASGVPKNFAA